MQTDTWRRSPDIRPVWPEGRDEPDHPRCIELVDAVLDIKARGAGVSFRDLIQAGFTSAEITEHHSRAEAIIAEREVKHVFLRPDLLADIIAKAKAPVPNAPPMPRDTAETQAMIVAWGGYCAARSALLLDPWSGQRERCLKVLTAYLGRLPIFQANRDAVIKAVAAALPQVAA